MIVPKFQGENFYSNKAIVEEIKKLASRKGCTLTQIALAWVAAQGFIAIPGTTKASRLEDNFASRNVDLTENEKEEMRNIIDNNKISGHRYNERAGYGRTLELNRRSQYHRWLKRQYAANLPKTSASILNVGPSTVPLSYILKPETNISWLHLCASVSRSPKLSSCISSRRTLLNATT